MKLNAKVLALMALLSIGAASAQTLTADSPNAGTKIQNTAQASFTIPGTTTTETISSNTVTTTVTAIQYFNIDYKGGGDADTTDTTAGAISGYTKTLPAGSTAEFTYTAINSGNGEQKIYLSTSVTGVDAATVKYYDTAGQLLPTDPVTGQQYIIVAPEGDNPSTTSVVENNPGSVDFVMKYTVPAATNSTTVVGATPIGTGEVFNGTANVATTEQKDVSGATYDDLFWQYNAVTVQNNSLELGGNGTPTTDNTPVASDCTTTTGTKTVTFTNTLQNTGNTADVFDITYVSTTGTTVVLKNKATGAVLTDTDGDGVVDTGSVAANATFDIQVEVTYTGCPATDITTTLTATSSVDPTKSNTTTDTITINQPGLAFGNQTPDGTNGDPNINADTNRANDVPGSTVNIPMEINNPGDMADTFTVEATPITFTVANPDGTTSQVPVTPTYQIDNGCDGTPDGTLTQPIAVPAGGTVCIVMQVAVPSGTVAGTTSPTTQTVTSQTTGATATDTNETITVGASGQVVVAKFTSYPNTLTFGPSYVTQDKTCVTDQPTTGLYIARPTTNVGASYGGYTCQDTEYAPGTTYSYRIVAKNFYNTPISNFSLSDAVPAPLIIQGTPTCTVTGGTCTATVTGNSVTSNKVDVPANGEMIITITVKIP